MKDQWWFLLRLLANYSFNISEWFIFKHFLSEVELVLCNPPLQSVSVTTKAKSSGNSILSSLGLCTICWQKLEITDADGQSQDIEHLHNIRRAFSVVPFWEVNSLISRLCRKPLVVEIVAWAYDLTLRAEDCERGNHEQPTITESCQ